MVKCLLSMSIIMDTTKITMLNHVDVLTDDYTIKVRIIRLWEQPDKFNPSQTFSIEMILIDEEGTRFQASVMKRWLPRFRVFLKEKETLLIQKPTLAENRAKLKYVDNGNKLCFNYDTTVSLCTDFSGSYYGFLFVPFKSIQERSITENVTVDVIGYISKCYQMETLNTRSGKESTRMNLRILDMEGRRLNVTLWDEYAQQMSSYVTNNPDEVHVIIIIQFGMLNYYKDVAYLNNAYQVSRLYINNDIDEIKAFRKSYLGEAEDTNTSSAQVGIGSSMVTNLEDEFLNSTDFRLIAEVNEIKQVKYVVVVGTIKAISLDTSWYYIGCQNCNRKVTTTMLKAENSEGGGDDEEKEVLDCGTERCKKQGVAAAPRFRIPIRVQDHTGIASLTLFDRDAIKLLKTSAKNLVDNFEKMSGVQLYPEEFNDLLERKFAFKIEVSDYNLVNKKPYYSISKLTNAPSILEKLEDNYNTQQTIDSKSVNVVTMSDFQSQNSVGLKDTVSFTAENVTPVSDGQKKMTRSPLLEEQTPLKRTIDSVYDVDAMEAASSSKTRPNSVDNAVPTNEKAKLLTPKIEK